jgi:hypothetical protein
MYIVVFFFFICTESARDRYALQDVRKLFRRSVQRFCCVKQLRHSGCFEVYFQKSNPDDLAWNTEYDSIGPDVCTVTEGVFLAVRILISSTTVNLQITKSHVLFYPNILLSGGIHCH